MSEAVVANKHDARFTVGYEVEPGRIVPLCIKTPKYCLSSGVSRFNEASPWKMGFNIDITSILKITDREFSRATENFPSDREFPARLKTARASE